MVMLEHFESKNVPSRKVAVYLPPNYDTTARYPVIYFTDGQNVFFDSTAYGGVSWGIAQTLDSLIDNEYVAPAIVVAVWNHPNRWSEYLPEPCATARLDSSWGMPYARPEIFEAGIYGSHYLRFLVEELKPHIDGHFATQADVAHTYAMGSSMGGLLAAYAVAEHPETFGAAACLSTHWPAIKGACLPYFQQTLSALPTHRFYFDFGDKGLDSLYAPYQTQLDSAMHAAGFDDKHYKSAYYPGADHNERSWCNRAAQPLRFLLDAPKISGE